MAAVKWTNTETHFHEVCHINFSKDLKPGLGSKPA